jgi:RNA polymerase sigma-70 factor (ECF subfamily)
MALIDDGDANMPTTPRTPEDDAAGRELRRLLEEHIDALPDAYRVVFVMREVDELDTAETAACLGLTEEAVRVRLHRARQALQQSLAAVFGTSLADAFRFDGERCDRIVAGVLGRLGTS